MLTDARFTPITILAVKVTSRCNIKSAKGVFTAGCHSGIVAQKVEQQAFYKVKNNHCVLFATDHVRSAVFTH